METISREKAIGLLVDNDIKDIINGYYENDSSYINDILRDGMKGYDNFTLEELQTEYDASIVEMEKGYPAIIFA